MKKRMVLASLALASTVGGNALGQPVPVGCEAAKGGEAVPAWYYQAMLFKLPWHEVEEGFQGVFTPSSSNAIGPETTSGRFAATWRKGMERHRATLDISVQGAAVTIVRRTDQGNCSYIGTLSGHWRVTGSYNCDWHPGRLAWSAVVGPGRDALPCPPSGTADARLNKVWHESEDGWNGTFTPKGGYGNFQAFWSKQGEAPPYAGLAIQISGSAVTIWRTGAEGNCTYNGRLTGNGYTASGSYTCDWHPQAMLWSATIGEGHP